jgi:hypothetical protein
MELNLPAPDKTLEAVDQAIIAANPPSVRSYLQCSSLGKDCERDLWYNWRWTIPVTFDAATLRRFGDGFAGEDLMAARLRAVPGIKLQTHYDDGTQFEVHDMGGHLLGHLDGVIEGVAAAPKTMHVWEHKQVQQKTFNKLEKLKREHGEKEALELWNSTYYGQAQLYMSLTKLTRHYLTVTTPGGRDITSCRTDYDAAAAKMYLDKARRIFESAEAPRKISAKADYFQCRWCAFKEPCHGTKVAQVNCRTCAHSTPIKAESSGDPGKPKRKGNWRCEFHDKRISFKKQTEGCQDHLFIPSLIPWADPVKFDREGNRIVYVTKNTQKPFINATRNDWAGDPPAFKSNDLSMLTEDLLTSESKVLNEMARFDGAAIESIKKNDDGVPFNDEIPKLF